MPRYLLDTTVLIDLARRRPDTVRGVRDLVANDGVVGICAINVAEFYAGALPGRDPAMDSFVRRLAFWPITSYVAMLAGGDRFRHARRGITLSTADTLVASAARAQRATIVTANARHFPMDDVAVLDTRTWS
jgi:predicted nucleic acid-binding protein